MISPLFSASWRLGPASRYGIRPARQRYGPEYIQSRFRRWRLVDSCRRVHPVAQTQYSETDLPALTELATQVLLSHITTVELLVDRIDGAREISGQFLEIVKPILNAEKHARLLFNCIYRPAEPSAAHHAHRFF
ncbi:MAG TPA: hypothetical protein VH592_12700 [Gemmataceae bacterium]